MLAKEKPTVSLSPSPIPFVDISAKPGATDQYFPISIRVQYWGGDDFSARYPAESPTDQYLYEWDERPPGEPGSAHGALLRLVSNPIFEPYLIVRTSK